MKDIIVLLFIVSIVLFMGYTTIGCKITSSIVVKLIQLLHLLLIVFITLGPFIIKEKEFLLFYVVMVSFIIFHWIVSSDVCALTLIEQWMTGNKSEFTFIGRIVQPVYNVKNRHIMCVTVVLLFIAFARLFKMYGLL